MTTAKTYTAFEALEMIKDQDLAMRPIQWEKDDFVSSSPAVLLDADSFWSKWNKKKCEELGRKLNVLQSYTLYKHNVGVIMGWTPTALDLQDTWVTEDVRLLPYEVIKGDEDAEYIIRYELLDKDHENYFFKRINDHVSKYHDVVFITTSNVEDHSGLVSLLLNTTNDLIKFNGTIQTHVGTSTKAYANSITLNKTLYVNPFPNTSIKAAIKQYVSSHPDCYTVDEILFIIDEDAFGPIDKVKALFIDGSYQVEYLSFDKLIVGVNDET